MIQVLFPKISFFEILSKFYEKLIKFKGNFNLKKKFLGFNQVLLQDLEISQYQSQNIKSKKFDKFLF